jgi:hypothetical protein
MTMNNVPLARTYPPRTTFLIRTGLLLIALLLTLGAETRAQEYTCFPTCSETDGRFLSLADASFNTLSNNLIVLKLGSAGVSSTVNIGIFDGETSGRWDVGTTPLIYTLYADPDGDGFGSTVVATWSGATMPDNAWFNVDVPNNVAARAPNGNYLYALHIKSSDSLQRYWTNFKVHSSGSILLKTQLFSVSASMATPADEQVIYPAFPALTPTTYDGTWNFYIDVPLTLTELTIWDGDMDHGNFDCTELDSDDPDTPPAVPSFGTPNTRSEGVAAGNPCVNGAGTPTGGVGTGTPPDDNVYPQYRRSPAVNYDVIHPNGTVYANENPSGNLEWERFRIATAPMNRAAMDYHADSLPTGIYLVRVEGMDLSNLNAWRFSQDLIGVDDDGNPVPPLRPHTATGVVCLVNGPSCSSYVANARVVINGDLDGNGVLDVNRSTYTDANGRYNFPNLDDGTYTIYVTPSTLPTGANPVDDYDGVATPNRATVTFSTTQADPANIFFQYSVAGSTSTGRGVRSQGYWKNHPQAWPVTSIQVGCTTYTRARAIEIMKTAPAGDKSYSMFVQLIAAKLNVAAGATSTCIVSTISSADTWLCNNRLGSNVGGSSNAWRSGSPMHAALDDYNNGEMCAPHLD